MQNTGWVALLQRIPAEYRDNLIITTRAGSEIYVQAILSLEQEFVVLRGRPVGSTDEGRAVIIPLDQIDFVCSQRSMKEAEILAMMGSSTSPIALPRTEAKPAAMPEPAPAETTSPPEAPAPAPADAFRPVTSPRPAILERLKARKAAASAQPAPPPSE